ncbi:MAG: sulfotransferase family 2 domain-containing protein, partial [Campylobacterota bacterium]
MSFYNALLNGKYFYNSTKQDFAYIHSFRIDKTLNKETLNNWNKDFLNISHLLITSHLPFGAHHKFNKKFLLTTCIREPFSRIVSAYKYHCRTTQTNPTEGGFKKFYKLKENISIASSTL